MMMFNNQGNGNLKGMDADYIEKIATDVFLTKGYTGTSMKDIAKEADVSENQIERQFGTKEEIFTKLVLKNTEVDSVIECCGTVLEMFVALVDDIKTEVLENTSRAAFLEMIIHSRDIPRYTKDTYLEKLKASRLYKSVDNARLHGIIQGNDTLSIIRLFLKSSFSILKTYKDAELEWPNNSWFLRMLHFDDDEEPESLEELVKKQNSVITAFASEFQSILFVDLDTDNIEVYQANGENDSWIVNTSNKGYVEFRRRFADRFLFPEDQEWFMKETDPENIKNRLMDDPVLYIDHRVISKGEPYFYQTIIVLDPMYSYGNRVLVGGHRIYKKGRPGVYAPPEDGNIEAVK